MPWLFSHAHPDHPARLAWPAPVGAGRIGAAMSADTGPVDPTIAANRERTAAPLMAPRERARP